GPGRDEERVRPRAHPRGRGGGAGAGDRFGRRGDAGAPLRRPRRGQGGRGAGGVHLPRRGVHHRRGQGVPRPARGARPAGGAGARRECRRRRVMIHGCVTLEEVFAAAGARAASLVPETSGYLALAVGDATSRLPFAIDDRQVMLTTEGSVGITKRGEILPPKQAAGGLRDVLARLLAVSTGTTMPSLAAAARPREES